MFKRYMLMIYTRQLNGDIAVATWFTEKENCKKAVEAYKVSFPYDNEYKVVVLNVKTGIQKTFYS